MTRIRALNWPVLLWWGFCALAVVLVWSVGTDSDSVFKPVANVQDETLHEYDRAVVVSTDNCYWCERMKPVVAELQRAGYDIRIVKQAECPVPVCVYPTILFFMDDVKAPVHSRVGYVDAAQLKIWLRK